MKGAAGISPLIGILIDQGPHHRQWRQERPRQFSPAGYAQGDFISKKNEKVNAAGSVYGVNEKRRGSQRTGIYEGGVNGRPYSDKNY